MVYRKRAVEKMLQALRQPPNAFFYTKPPYWQFAGYNRTFDWAQQGLQADAIVYTSDKIILSINELPDNPGSIQRLQHHCLEPISKPHG